MTRIEFFGEWDNASKYYQVKVEHTKFRLAMTVTLILSLTTLALFSLFGGIVIIYCLGFGILVIVLYLVSIIYPKIFLSEKLILSECPYKITIRENELVCDGRIQSAYYQKKYIDIKNIEDHGTFYCINFYYPNNPFICQKDLITVGTLKEFEEIFADYLVVKPKKKNK